MSKSLCFKFLPLLLLALPFLFLPGNSYYETVNLISRPSQVSSFNISLPSLPSLPEKRFSLMPQLTARAALLWDTDSGTILYAKNIHQRLPPASLTKMMTAMIVLDNFFDDQVISEDKIEDYGQVMGLQEGEQITVKNLLDGLLMFSANDAAYVFADAYPGGRSAFMEAMNKKAKALDLKDTYFTNPNGQYDPAHFSSAWDLARLARFAWQKEEFRQIVSQRAKIVCDVSGQICHPLVSTNQLLGVFPGTLGVKTGWVEEAGGCFVGFFNEGGHHLLSVVLGSDDRFDDTQELVGWGMVNFFYLPLIQAESIAGK